jgi:hypothetical protein
MNVLIVYYSNEGTTAKVAEGLALATGGTLRKLSVRGTPGPGAIMAAMLGLGARLVDPDYDVNGRDAIVLMTPVWAGCLTPAINTFIAHAQLRGQRVFFVTVGVLPTNPRAVAAMERRLKRHGALVIGHEEVLGKQPKMDSAPSDKKPQPPAQPDPTDDQLAAAGVAVARTLEAALLPGMNEADP